MISRVNRPIKDMSPSRPLHCLHPTSVLFFYSVPRPPRSLYCSVLPHPPTPTPHLLLQCTYPWLPAYNGGFAVFAEISGAIMHDASIIVRCAERVNLPSAVLLEVVFAFWIQSQFLGLVQLIIWIIRIIKSNFQQVMSNIKRLETILMTKNTLKE